ncbi:hypothetical protein V8G54_013843, partial [Vigna mungo]
FSANLWDIVGVRFIDKDSPLLGAFSVIFQKLKDQRARAKGLECILSVIKTGFRFLKLLLCFNKYNTCWGYYNIRLKILDKEWTKLPRFSKEYVSGIELFSDFAYSRGRARGNEILCPCSKCRNLYWARRNVVYDHLIGIGVLKGYNIWFFVLPLFSLGLSRSLKGRDLLGTMIFPLRILGSSLLLDFVLERWEFIRLFNGWKRCCNSLLRHFPLLRFVFAGFLLLFTSLFNYDGCCHLQFDVLPQTPMAPTEFRLGCCRSTNLFNKPNTKVDMRFNVKNAHWLSDRVRDKILQTEKNRINKEGDLVISSTKTRTQKGNIEDALAKLQEIIDAASYVPPPPSEEQKKKIAKMAGIGEQNRLKSKKVLSVKKAFRRSKNSWDYHGQKLETVISI